MSLEGEVVEAVASPMKSVKLVIGVVIATILVIALGLAYYFYKQNLKSHETIGQTKEQVAEVKQNLEVANVHGDASNEGQTVADAKKTDLETGVRTVKKKQAERIEQVVETVKDPVEQENAKAEVRMQGIWDTYCLVESQDASCQNQAVQAKSSADQTQTEGPHS